VEWAPSIATAFPTRLSSFGSFVVAHNTKITQDVMLVRRKLSSMSAPNTPHASLPPTPLRVLASPRLGLAGVVSGVGGTSFSGVGNPPGVGAAGSLVAKLAATAAAVSAASSTGAEGDVMSTQVFHVARLLRYKVYLLQQVSSAS
jgi:hypothetical protein